MKLIKFLNEKKLSPDERQYLAVEIVDDLKELIKNMEPGKTKDQVSAVYKNMVKLQDLI
jgi:hypothetical protein